MASRKPSRARRRPRQERSRDLVESLVTATRRVIEVEGTGRATTNRIAEVAGVSIGSLYQYFPSKREMVGVVRERHREAFGARLTARIGELARLPLEPALRRLVELMADLHLESLRLHNALHGDEAADADRFHEELEQRWLPTALAYFAEHRGELRPANHALAARIAFAVLEALTHGAALRAPEQLVDPEYREEVSQLLLRYLAK